MYDSFVLTIVGPDRPGLVEALSEAIAAHQGNWVESRMATVAGQFAGLIWITVPTEHAEQLEQAIERLQNDPLRIVLQRAEAATPQPARVLRLEWVGHDRPGIVRDLTRELARRDINVEELTTECCSAPMTGEPLFRARVELGVPADVALNELLQALEELSNQLCLDMTYDESQPVAG